MQFALYTSVFVSIIVSVCSYTIPDATVELLKPKGFRLSIPHEDGITEVSFNVKIDQRIALYQPGDFAAIIKELTNDRWAFDNINTSIQPGNKINYWVHVQFGKLGKNFREIGTATVSSSTGQILSFCPDNAVQQECPAAITSDCELSATTVGGKSVCKGQLIFDDTFDSLDWKKWDREVRIPLAADDGQFVSFQNRPDNCYVGNNQLHITPSLLSDFPGFDLPRIRAGQLNLEAQCTAISDRSQECKRGAQYFQILPPIVSARIRTKNSFSFRFGKVEIRAKLPKGDWLFPLILLEPLENYYGLTGYASGQIRIAFNRGNEFLQDENARDISNKLLFGGAVMTTAEKLRSAYLSGKNMQVGPGNDFHIYTLIWTEDHLVLGVDGTDYAVIKENFSRIQKQYHGNTNSDHKMAPFDREFYLTLGVSAGGHSDFPDESRNGPSRIPKPWKNGDPKAELYFWKDRNNWYKTWNADTGLHVDYVRVFAL